ncbi:lytic murein transglycosylase [Donghicola sp. C2-DW-16]|uniref:Lytic murein transglycosylase n=1 Tax=Donghicola mangrovi TaxID=2729614 RepID=A0ABX2PGV1_9RHOB|nr:lytic murein transglycosylase [Donghicola mangrovi]NVO28718.1 lytic murein transglycosylase [Donghicola mangrovi]
MRLLTASLFALGLALPAHAQSCGGDWGTFINGLKSEAMQRGHSQATVDAFFSGAQQSAAVLKADRAQGVFQKDFIDFSKMLISKNRIQAGAQKWQQYRSTFDRIQAQYGINPGVLLAFWAFETDYGGYQGDFNTRNALVTLAHDCRRPDLFRPQVLSAIRLFENGDFDPQTTTGAWAGEIGMVQMLPGDILENGVDGDGDGHVRLKTSAPDALMSGARMLSSLGWRANEPWLQEITVPQDMDWSQTGLLTRKTAAEWQAMGVQARSGALLRPDLPSSIILPMGRKGPAFLAYPNFNVYFEWNQSFTYVLTAAYFGTRLEGAPAYAAGNPEPGLSGPQIKQLQQKLQARGYDVGGADGILGEKSREAVQDAQKRLGLPADAWPTQALLNQL